MSARPPVLDETRLSPTQQAVFDKIRSGPRGLVEGPLRVWVQSPELAEQAQALGAYCRYGTRLSQRLSELAILTVGSYWQSGFEWHVHAPIGLRAGLDPSAVEAIRKGHTPVLVKEDELAVYRFAHELLTTKRVSAESYDLAVKHLGLEGAIDLTGILGYYTLISMTINAFEVPVPPGAPEPFGDIAKTSK
jgi:4-carboxymuconolactone decarboxylase